MHRSWTSEVTGDVRTCVGRMLSRNCPNAFRQWGSRRDRELGRFVLGGPPIVQGDFGTQVWCYLCAVIILQENSSCIFPKGFLP